MSQRNRLSAHDSVFLSWERPEQPMHVGECMVYEGLLTASDMVGMLRARMHLLPRYRQKVLEAPFGLAHPTWEDDADFDLDNHVTERELPGSGDDRALSRFCGELYCELLDRRRPLWHLTVIHGHSSGNTVVFLKLHHAMVDGVSSVELIEVLHSTERSAPPPPPPLAEWTPRQVPSVIDRLRGVAADQASDVLDRVRGVTELIRAGGPSSLLDRATATARAVIDTAPVMLRPLPETPFNAPIHAERDFAWVELPIEETKVVRAALGGTVNGMVLAILSGAIARYMRRHGHEPDGRELQALCLVSVRRPDQSGNMGNLISMIVAHLYVGMNDAGERFSAEHAATQDLKARRQAVGLHEIISAAEWCPAPLYSLMWKLWPRSYFPLHVTSTNVPGPKQPLYLGDRELLHWYLAGVQWTNNALFLCTLSYRENLILGPMVDPQIVPDVWDFAADLQAAYDELRVAAGLPGTPTAPETAAPATSISAAPSLR